MSISSLLPLVALIWIAGPQGAQDEQVSYGASVTFADGKCWFWTGDVGLTAAQFQSDLESRFDRRNGIVISHSADTPARCVEQARLSATRAGFKDVRTAVGAGTGPIGPPIAR